jgi:eukaryotic-like serine/threonine-protein kinase
VLGFLKRRPLWFNLLIALGLSVFILIIFLQTLRYWTNHGDYLRVPDVKGKTIEAATQMLEASGFDVLVQDSVYFDTLAPLAVFKQFPDPDATVKVNRTVYLTINRSNAPLIDMPNLVGMSFRNAELELRANGLKLGDTSYVPDIAKNAVKDQIYKGESIRPRTKIAMGSAIALVLGAGIGSTEIPVPDLFGLPYSEAIALLEANNITVGVITKDSDLNDYATGFVYRQNPERFDDERKLNRIRSGQMVDIWLSVNKPARIIDTTQKSLPAQLSQDY